MEICDIGQEDISQGSIASFLGGYLASMYLLSEEGGPVGLGSDTSCRYSVRRRQGLGVAEDHSPAVHSHPLSVHAAVYLVPF